MPQFKGRPGPNSVLHQNLEGKRKQTLRNHSGAAFQDDVLATCQWYSLRGEAEINKLHNPTAGWGKTLRVTGKADADFGGLIEGGRGIAFEAKGVTGRVGYAHDSEALHQLSHLARVHARGGISFLLLGEQRERVAFLLGPLWFPMLMAGKSIPFAEHDGQGNLIALVPWLKAQPKPGRPQWDFLPIALQAFGR
jgi:penicillin-binding protein-related factor A (putative recombinase)